MSFAKWWPFCFGLNVLMHICMILRNLCIHSNILSVIRVADRVPKATEMTRRINTLRPRQNGRPFEDDIFKCIFLNENARISLAISMKFVPMVQIKNIPALVQIMAWRRPGDKPLSEPMMVSLLKHICVTRSQWDKGLHGDSKRLKVCLWTWIVKIIQFWEVQFNIHLWCKYIGKRNLLVNMSLEIEMAIVNLTLEVLVRYTYGNRSLLFTYLQMS